MDGDQDLTVGVSHVVRVGDTVRRPVRPFTASVQAYLQHLRLNGFDGAPEPLGVDGEGREVLSYVEGEVPHEPLPDWAATDGVIEGLARLVRRLHDASTGWVPPADAHWGSIPGNAVTEPLFEEPELVSHQDYCPGNVVFRERLPTALIDFDLARPTSRVADCVNALTWWAPLRDPCDRAPGLREVDAAARVRLFATAYGMSAAQREAVVSVALQYAANCRVTMRAAADTHPVFRQWWEEGTRERLERAEVWLTGEAPRIQRALKD